MKAQNIRNLNAFLQQIPALQEEGWDIEAQNQYHFRITTDWCRGYVDVYPTTHKLFVPLLDTHNAYRYENLLDWLPGIFSEFAWGKTTA